MSGVATAIAGSALVGGVAAYAGAQSQSKATKNAAQLQYQQWLQQNEQQQPFLQAGYTGTNKLLEYLGLGGNTMSPDYGAYYKPFNPEDYIDEGGYQFRLGEGLKAVEGSAAARGLLQSGATLKGIENFAQGLASNEYMNAFNRYQAERNAMLNPLQSLMGAGQTTAQTLGQAGQTYANNSGELGMQGANARASGYMGTANALSGALTNYLGYQQNQQQNQLLTKYLTTKTPTTTAPVS